MKSNPAEDTVAGCSSVIAIIAVIAFFSWMNSCGSKSSSPEEEAKRAEMRTKADKIEICTAAIKEEFSKGKGINADASYVDVTMDNIWKDADNIVHYSSNGWIRVRYPLKLKAGFECSLVGESKKVQVYDVFTDN